RPDRRAVAGRHDAGRLPAHAPHDAGPDRRLGRRLQAVRRGHRPELPGDEGGLGTVVGAERRRPPRVPGGDRQALLHAPEPVAHARDASLSTEAPRAAVRAEVTTAKYGPQAEGWSDDAYADAQAY